jgi:hypothetical protein
VVGNKNNDNRSKVVAATISDESETESDSGANVARVMVGTIIYYHGTFYVKVII